MENHNLTETGDTLTLPHLVYTVLLASRYADSSKHRHRTRREFTFARFPISYRQDILLDLCRKYSQKQEVAHCLHTSSQEWTTVHHNHTPPPTKRLDFVK